MSLREIALMLVLRVGCSVLAVLVVVAFNIWRMRYPKAMRWMLLSLLWLVVFLGLLWIATITSNFY